MAPRLTWERLTLKLRNPFGLSYGTDETRPAFWIRLEGDEGWGEGTIPSYYNIPDEEMFACWKRAAAQSTPFPDDPGAIAAWAGDGPAPARAGIDLALHDRIGRRRGAPIWRLLDLPAPQRLPTSFTISIAAPAEMARLASEARGFPVLKIKLGSADDEGRLAAVREALSGRAAAGRRQHRMDAGGGGTAPGGDRAFRVGDGRAAGRKG